MVLPPSSIPVVPIVACPASLFSNPINTTCHVMVYDNMEFCPSPEHEQEVCMRLQSLVRDGSMFDFTPAVRDFVHSRGTVEGEQV